MTDLATTRESKRILILEDTLDLLRLYSKVLGNAGYKVEAAQNLREAEAVMVANPLDVFICDLHLGDEHATTKLDRWLPNLQEAGTLVVIVSVEAEYRRWCEERGTDLFLVKPIHMEDLVIFIDRLLLKPRRTAGNR